VGRHRALRSFRNARASYAGPILVLRLVYLRLLSIEVDMQTKSNRSYQIWQLLGILLFVIPACAALNSRFNWVDDSYYIMLAKALAIGRGYTNINLPVPTRHSHFPPGLPLLLSLPMLLDLPLNTTIVISKLVLIGCGALGLWGLARLARLEGYPDFAIPWALALSAASIAFVTFTCRVASEMLYFPLSVFALMAICRYRRSPYRSWWLPTSVVLVGAMILTRSVGIFLLAAVGMDLLRKREFRRLVLIAAPVGVILAAWAWSTRAATPGTGDYIKEFVYLYRSSRATSVFPALAGIVGNVWVLISVEIPRTIFSVVSSEAVRSHRLPNLALLPLRVGISVVALWPIPRGRRPEGAPTRLYLVFYLIVISLWPSDPSRYLVAIGPFLCFSFTEGAAAVFEDLSSLGIGSLAPPRTMLYWAIAICIASNLVSDARFVATVRRTGDFSPEAAKTWNDCIDAYRWLGDSTGASSVIGCLPTIEAQVYLMTDRKTVPLTAHQEGWQSLGVTHILELNDKSSYGSVDRRVEDRVFRTVQRAAASGFLTEVYHNPDITIYEVGQSAGQQGSSQSQADDPTN
jgi:hypothetical protein